MRDNILGFELKLGQKGFEVNSLPIGQSTGSNYKDFYVYEWFLVDTGEIFYVGKGRGKRAYQRNNILRYESGEMQNFSNEVIMAMADFLKVSPAYLMGWTDIHEPNYNIVPIIEEVNERNYYVTTYRTVAKKNYDADDLIFCKINDDNMLPMFKRGSKVLIHKTDKVEKGKYVGVKFNDNDQITICHYLKHPRYDAFQTEYMKRSGEIFIADNDKAAQIIGEVIPN